MLGSRILASAAAVGLALGAPAAGAAVATTDDRTEVWLNVQRSRNVSLYLVEPQTPSGPWRNAAARRASTRLCDAPCGIPLDVRGRELFVGGPGLVNSNGFTVRGDAQRVVVDVRPGRAALRAIGWVATIVGAVGLVGGATTMAFADNDRRILVAGGITLGASIPVMIFGGVSLAFGRTRVEARPVMVR